MGVFTTNTRRPVIWCSKYMPGLYVLHSDILQNAFTTAIGRPLVMVCRDKPFLGLNTNLKAHVSFFSGCKLILPLPTCQSARKRETRNIAVHRPSGTDSIAAWTCCSGLILPRVIHYDVNFSVLKAPFEIYLWKNINEILSDKSPSNISLFSVFIRSNFQSIQRRRR